MDGDDETSIRLTELGCLGVFALGPMAYEFFPTPIVRKRSFTVFFDTLRLKFHGISPSFTGWRGGLERSKVPRLSNKKIHSRRRTQTAAKLHVGVADEAA
jgi:hypothetical protein